MKITPIKTKRFQPPQDDLFPEIRKRIKTIPERSIVIIAAKIISISEGNTYLKSSIRKKDLIIQEADQYLEKKAGPFGQTRHTIKNNILAPAAGVDDSNGGNYYIAWPKNPYRSAKKIWSWLRKTYQINNVGIIIADSHSVPLRRGTIGIALSYHGFRALKDYRGKKDLYQRKLKITVSNHADALAAAAVLVMGEGAESTPLAIIREIPQVEFVQRQQKSNQRFSNLEVPLNEDIYAPFLNQVNWQKKGT
jgi:putative folate metabolism gamma-glutamate ligase